MKLFSSFLSRLFSSNDRCTGCGKRIKPGYDYHFENKGILCKTCYNKYRLEKENEIRLEKAKNLIEEEQKRKEEERQRIKERLIKEQQEKKEREIKEQQKLENEMKTRAIKAVRAFNSDRTCNDAYVVESGGTGFLVCGNIITYDSQSDQWFSANNGNVHFYKTTMHSEYSGYHDEDNYYYSSEEIEMPAGWNESNLFTQAFGIAEDAFNYESSDYLPIDAFYYEGFGKASLRRWSRRSWMVEEKQGLFIIYLRRNSEGYRLLRICMKEEQLPFELRFTEKDISRLYHEYGNQCYLFEDFLLTPSECLAFNADAGMKMQGLGNIHLNPSCACFVRKSNQLQTEIIKPWYEGMIQTILGIRCRVFEDYWGEKPS